jgi:cation transporter-like permease
MKNVKTSHIIFIIVSVGLSSSISLIGGLGIEAVHKELLLIAPLLIALPALNSLVGDYATLIAAHAGNPKERNLSRLQLIKAMLPSVITSTLIILGTSLLLANHRGFKINPNFFGVYTLFIICAVILVITIMFLLTILLDKLLEKKGLNPDDILIPVVTTVSDIFMLGLVALAVKFLF